MEATLESFTIVATVTSPALADTHHRQPAIIDSHRFDDWFDPNSPLPRLVELVREPHASPYEACPISTRVNTDRNDAVPTSWRKCSHRYARSDGIAFLPFVSVLVELASWRHNARFVASAVATTSACHAGHRPS